MSKKILYFSNSVSGSCQEESFFKVYLLKNDLSQLEVEEMIKDKSFGRYCPIHERGADSGDCGLINCNEYEPKNGKFGECKFLNYWYSRSGRKFLITKEGKKLLPHREICKDCNTD